MMGFIFILSVISMAICAFIAQKRRLNGTAWTIMAGFLGPLAIPFALTAKQGNNNKTK